MSVNFLNETYYLSVLNNCDQNKRFVQWQNDGGTLLGNKNLGCGINSLTFLFSPSTELSHSTLYSIILFNLDYKYKTILIINQIYFL